jgi:hypothetical protein
MSRAAASPNVITVQKVARMLRAPTGVIRAELARKLAANPDNQDEEYWLLHIAIAGKMKPDGLAAAIAKHKAAIADTKAEKALAVQSTDRTKGRTKKENNCGNN